MSNNAWLNFPQHSGVKVASMSVGGLAFTFPQPLELKPGIHDMAEILRYGMAKFVPAERADQERFAVTADTPPD